MSDKGYKKLKNTAKKIEKEINDEKELVEATMESIIEKPSLLKLYKDNALLGSTNLGGALPLLKVHSVGRSKNELADGSEPNDGWFFYSQDASQYKEVYCHILSISKGFRREGIDPENKKLVFNQLVGGLIIDGDDLKPFISYFTGMKLSNMWDFGKEASKYTKSKDFPIPLFALKVKLTTSQEKHQYGKSWVINFELVRKENGNLDIVEDEGVFVYLKDSVSIIEQYMDNVVETKSGEEIPVSDEDYDVF